MCYIGLDAGTTGIKALAISSNGHVLASSYREYTMLTSREGWCELNPHEMWASAQSVLSEICNGIEEPIEAIAVSSQAQATVPLDNEGNPLYNFIATIDTRTVEEYQWWMSHADEKEIFLNTGLTFSPIYTVNKIMWFMKHMPHIHGKASHYVNVEDYLNYRLTGEFIIDFTLANRGMMLNAKSCQWDKKILKLAGIDPSLLSTPVPSATCIGRIKKSVAEVIGIPNNTKIITGAHDQVCGAIGSGAVECGQTTNANGTVEVLMTIIQEFPSDHKLMDLHYSCAAYAVDKTFSIMSINQNSGILLKWYKNNFCTMETAYAKANQLDPYAHIINHSSDKIADLYVLPHLNGTETPVLDPLSAAAIVRLKASHTKADITRALLDCMAYDMRQNIEAIESAGYPITSIRAIGGGAKSPKFLQIKADVTQRPIISMQVKESAALGAAMLAAVGTGAFNSCKEAVSSMVRMETTYEPNVKMKNSYDIAYAEFIQLYPALCGFNQMVSKRVSNYS